MLRLLVVLAWDVPRLLALACIAVWNFSLWRLSKVALLPTENYCGSSKELAIPETADSEQKLNCDRNFYAFLGSSFLLEVTRIGSE